LIIISIVFAPSFYLLKTRWHSFMWDVVRYVEYMIVLLELPLSSLYKCHIKARCDTGKVMLEWGALNICSRWEFWGEGDLVLA